MSTTNSIIKAAKINARTLVIAIQAADRAKALQNSDRYAVAGPSNKAIASTKTAGNSSSIVDEQNACGSI